MTKKEIYSHLWQNVFTGTHLYTEEQLSFAMEEYGKETYNQAIEDAAASVEIGYTYGHGSEYINKESILKLKK